ncbi:MAG: serine protease [Pseudomonadales bacterium]
MKINLHFVRTVLSLVSISLLSVSLSAQTTLDQRLSSSGTDPRHKSVVRVVVDDSVASGFVWQNSKQVITSLHALRAKPASIHVECRGTPYRAKVKKYLRRADLALLQTTEAMAGCTPLSSYENNRPSGKPTFTAYGYKPGNSTSTTKNLRKASAANETLKHLVSEKLAKSLEALKMPSIHLPIYYVTGGVYKGYSGGPVFHDDTGKLVGIVEGGLDKGTSNHNWLIPAPYIGEMMKGPDVSDVPSDIANAEFYYSSVAREVGSKFIIEKVDGEFTYKWSKTKTKTFEQLEISANPAEGLTELWDHIVPTIVTDAERNLAFDVYEDQNLGLIIVVPSGHKLKYELVDGEWYLVTELNQNSREQVEFAVQHGHLEFEDSSGQTIEAGDPEFFSIYMNTRLTACSQGNIQCEVDEDIMRLIDYGDGKQILKVGFKIHDSASDTTVYIFESIAVKGKEALVSKATINFGADSSVAKCMSQETEATCGSTFWLPASYMIAAQLTSISDLSVGALEPRVETNFSYDCVNCVEEQNNAVNAEQESMQNMASEQAGHAAHTQGVFDTTQVGYFEGDLQIFQHQGGAAWVVYTNQQWVNARETSRDADYVYLQAQDGTLYYLGIQGGPYGYRYSLNDQWQAAGSVHVR